MKFLQLVVGYVCRSSKNRPVGHDEWVATIFAHAEIKSKMKTAPELRSKNWAKDMNFVGILPHQVPIEITGIEIIEPIIFLGSR